MEKLTCPYSRRCGGCQLLHLTYREELAHKQAIAQKYLSRFGRVQPILGAANPCYYRNKVEAAFGTDRSRRVIAGTYEPHSHRIVNIERCLNENQTAAAIIATIQDREYVVKTDKKLSPTKLGEVVNGLMMDRFPNIISVEFTADMEKQLDQVEAGQRRWKNVLEEFYTDFHQEMLDAEEALKDTRLKVPDEVSEEKCEICGRNLVVKTSRFGKFLACPGYPECKFTKAITEKMPGRCPKCGSAILKRKSKRGYAYYACERGAACGFMTWDVPTDQDCPVCGQTMFKRSGKGAMKPFCANPECSNFLPEDKRGYRRRSTASGEAATAESNAEAAAEAAQKQAEVRRTRPWRLH